MLGQFANKFLKGVVAGVVDDAYLRDYTHASKTFRTNSYANAPKPTWLFHVYFEINEQILAGNGKFAFPDERIPGLLVKKISLPGFKVSLSEMNQYNRSRYIQTKIETDSIQIEMHDDNSGALRKLWHNYYTYHAHNLSSTRDGYDNGTIHFSNIYSPDISDSQDWGTNGDGIATPIRDRVKPQFFKSIKIYGLHQKEFSCYTLVNPVIENFKHSDHDVEQINSVMSATIDIRYENVIYEKGETDYRNPEAQIKGFGSEQFYDRTPSPLSKNGGNRTIAGTNGLIDGLGGIISDLSKQPPDLLGAAITGLRTRNAWSQPGSLKSAIKGEINNAVSSTVKSVASTALRSAKSSFPTPKPNNSKSTA
jgi:hypothetical protein